MGYFDSMSLATFWGLASGLIVFSVFEQVFMCIFIHGYSSGANYDYCNSLFYFRYILNRNFPIYKYFSFSDLRVSPKIVLEKIKIYLSYAFITKNHP